jgi:hypothetical protein
VIVLEPPAAGEPLLLVDDAPGEVVAFQRPWTIDREPSISKYCVSCPVTAPGSLNDRRMLTPSTGCCGTPSTTAGGSIPAASSTVGNRSVTCVNCSRTAPAALMPRGQCAISGVRVPPSQV